MDDIGAHCLCVYIVDIVSCTRCVKFVGFQIRYNVYAIDARLSFCSVIVLPDLWVCKINKNKQNVGRYN